MKPLNVLQERRRRGEEPPVEELSDEAALLTEIRDLLVTQSGPAGVAGAAPSVGQPRPADEPPSSTGW